MSSQHHELTEEETRRLREYVTAIVLNGQVTAQAAGLHPVDLYVLNLLDLEGGATAGKLAERTALTTGAVTKLIDRLVRVGLVERTADPTDRRRVVLRVVAANAIRALGEQAALFAPLATRMDRLIGSYPEEQRAVLFDFFTHATDELQRVTAELQQIAAPVASSQTPSQTPSDPR